MPINALGWVCICVFIFLLHVILGKLMDLLYAPGNINLQLFKMEDVSMGMWVEQFNTTTTVQYSHSWKFCQYGCMENYYTAHYQSPRQMICLWDKLARGRAHCCNFRWQGINFSCWSFSSSRVRSDMQCLFLFGGFSIIALWCLELFSEGGWMAGWQASVLSARGCQLEVRPNCIHLMASILSI